MGNKLLSGRERARKKRPEGIGQVLESLLTGRWLGQDFSSRDEVRDLVREALPADSREVTQVESITDFLFEAGFLTTNEDQKPVCYAKAARRVRRYLDKIRQHQRALR